MSLQESNNNIPQGAFSFPKEEEAVIKHWDDVNAFQRTLELTEDLPPFAFLTDHHLPLVLLITGTFWPLQSKILSHVMPP